MVLGKSSIYVLLLVVLGAHALKQNVGNETESEEPQMCAVMPTYDEWGYQMGHAPDPSMCGEGYECDCSACYHSAFQEANDCQCDGTKPDEEMWCPCRQDVNTCTHPSEERNHCRCTDNPDQLDCQCHKYTCNQGDQQDDHLMQ